MKNTFILIILAIALIAMLGCDDRGTGIEKNPLGQINSGIDANTDHVWHPQLGFQLRNPEERFFASAFIPAEAFADPPRPIPLLVLLAPEYGDRLHFFRAGLEDMVREMTASGEIQPMLIYCMAGNRTFGGFFYGNSAPAGFYDDILCDSLIDFLQNDQYFALVDNPSKRGIGGVGQGAYGAFRTVLKNPGLFSSISVADGPLDFDGPNGNDGLQQLFQTCLDEQHAYYAATGDTSPFDFHTDFDSSLTMPVSQMFIGGALAFSPNDTTVFFDPYVSVLDLAIDSSYRIADDDLPGGGDSTTLVTRIVNNANPSLNFDFHMPFDADGNVYQPIWDLWMRNNLEDIHTAVGGTPLADMNIWVASNPNAKWNYHEQTQSWVTFMVNQGYSVEEYDYSSFNDDPITEDEYLYDILREMLIFHSENFGN